MSVPRTDNTIGLWVPPPRHVRLWLRVQEWLAAYRRHVGAPPTFWREMGAMAVVLTLVLAVAHVAQPYSAIAFIVVLWGLFLVQPAR